MQLTNDVLLETIPFYNNIIASKPTYNNKHTQAPPFGHWKRDRESPEYDNINYCCWNAPNRTLK